MEQKMSNNSVREGEGVQRANDLNQFFNRFSQATQPASAPLLYLTSN